MGIANLVIGLLAALAPLVEEILGAAHPTTVAIHAAHAAALAAAQESSNG